VHVRARRAFARLLLAIVVVVAVAAVVVVAGRGRAARRPARDLEVVVPLLIELA
jgi:hypothetical protein